MKIHQSQNLLHLCIQHQDSVESLMDLEEGGFKMPFDSCINQTKLFIHFACFVFHSIRLLPHHQDTGGFFVAVITKVKPLPWTKQGKEMSRNGELCIGNQLIKCWGEGEGEFCPITKTQVVSLLL